MTETGLDPAHVRAERLTVIENLPVEMLARMIVAEGDDDAVVPPPGSPGEVFLRACRDAYVAWVRREGRFPDPDGTSVAELAGTWHRDVAVASRAAQAYVDLGLYLSRHGFYVADVGIVGMLQVLDNAAEEFVVTLTGDYGPLV